MKVCFFSGDITRSGGTERVSTVIANELVKDAQFDMGEGKNNFLPNIRKYK